MLLLTLLACPPKDAASLGPAVPVLPAMEAPLYTWSRGAPPDAAVARVAQDLPWDEALSGAAAFLALAATQGDPVDRAQARWAAYRAGWPYPLDEVVVQTVANGDVPERPPGLTGGAVGVARARGARGDAWVWLTSTPPVALEPFRRELPLGHLLELATQDQSPLVVRTAAPDGALAGDKVTLDQGGEWLVELTAADQTWIVPVYVDGPTPADAPYPHVMAPPQGTHEAQAQALEVLDELRATFDAPSLERDPLLDKAAGRALTARVNGQPLPPAADRLGKLGLTGHLYELSCTAPTVPECLDRLYWSIDHRGQLVDPVLAWAGVAASLGPAGVTLVVDLAQE